jgi:hypothetical protein
MADTWEVSVYDNTGLPADEIELTLAETGGGITDPIVPNLDPSLFVFVAPPPSNKLDAQLILGNVLAGQSFVIDFNLAAGLTPSFVSGLWGFGGTPFAFVESVPVFTDIRVPEPSTLILACFAIAGLTAWGWRQRKR